MVYPSGIQLGRWNFNSKSNIIVAIDFIVFFRLIFCFPQRPFSHFFYAGDMQRVAEQNVHRHRCRYSVDICR